MNTNNKVENENTNFIYLKKNFIENYNNYLNTIQHKCVTNSCKRRHEEILGNLKISIRDLEDFKTKLNKI